MGILSYFSPLQKDEAEKVDKLTASTLDTIRANRAGLQEAVGRLDDAMKSGLVLTMDRVMEECKDYGTEARRCSVR